MVQRKGTDAKLPVECVLPAVWRRTPTTLARLLSDGLASLLPMRDSSDPEAPDLDAGCYGRAYFAEQLRKRLTKGKPPDEPPRYDDSAWDVQFQTLVQAALTSDLRGE
jgi:hypothetical protein